MKEEYYYNNNNNNNDNNNKQTKKCSPSHTWQDLVLVVVLLDAPQLHHPRHCGPHVPGLEDACVTDRLPVGVQQTQEVAPAIKLRVRNIVKINRIKLRQNAM
jgi:hypothetical protein